MNRIGCALGLLLLCGFSQGAYAALPEFGEVFESRGTACYEKAAAEAAAAEWVKHGNERMQLKLGSFIVAGTCVSPPRDGSFRLVMSSTAGTWVKKEERLFLVEAWAPMTGGSMKKVYLLTSGRSYRPQSIA